MSFLDKMKETLNEGLNASRDIFLKAKDKAKELGEKGVINLEIMELKKQIEKLLAKLGTLTYDMLTSEGRQSISNKTPEVKEILEEIANLNEMTAKKEEELANYSAEANE